jgi:diguanylate cyclase
MTIELMSLGFLQNNDRTTRTDEAYRINSLGHNIAVEKERQRAALLDWGQHIAFNLHKGLELENNLLKHSEFGLWLTHKALSIFTNDRQMDEIVKAVTKIDTVLLPQILSAQLDKESLSPLLGSLQNEIVQIKYVLSTLFDNMLEIENGRDALTRLLNRRFLAPVLTREINIARNAQGSFCLLLLDIDFFKKVNDTYGHDGGDVVLQQTATILTNMLRSGDFIFRYGGEEIIILLVEVDLPTAQATAERIRESIEKTKILLANQIAIHITVSIGGAMFDGHPDYEYLIKRADDVLYEAKNSGRNRCIFSQ